jgi:hypothetical protein
MRRVNSSKKEGQKTLVTRLILGVVSEERARLFLQDVLNVRDQEFYQAVDKVPECASRYTDIIDFLEEDPDARRAAFKQLRDYLRLAWVAPDARQRDWWLVLARLSRIRFVAIKRLKQDRPEDASNPNARFLAIEEEICKVPEITPFEAVIYHLQQVASHLRYCKNPECPAPYFIARKNQQYCSSGLNECATYGQRVAKRNWWTDNRAKGERNAKRNDRKNQ